MWQTNPVSALGWRSILCKNQFVLIATCDKYAKNIEVQLDKVGIPHLRSTVFQVVKFWDEYRTVVKWLEDEHSKLSYLAMLWFWLRQDNRFIQTTESQYFAIKPFMYPVRETIVDAGAYVGDTTEELLKKSLGESSVFAFEPDPTLFKILESRTVRLRAEWNLENEMLTIVPAGLGARTEQVNFCCTGGSGSGIADTGESGDLVQIYALDDFFREKQHPTLIKADIEGAEPDLIHGAEQIITQSKPKLAICIYHSPMDAYLVPKLVHDLCPEYHFAVRNHGAYDLDTVLYCYTD